MSGVVGGAVLADLLESLTRRLEGELGPDRDSRSRIQLAPGSFSDTVELAEETVSIVVVSLQEERVMRAADPFVRRVQEGPAGLRSARPDIRLAVQVLFVARFKQAPTSWRCLGRVLNSIRDSPVLTLVRGELKPPEEGDQVDQRVSFTLLSPSLHEQNDLWSLLKRPLHPSLLYRMDLIVFSDATEGNLKPAVTRPVQFQIIQGADPHDVAKATPATNRLTGNADGGNDDAASAPQPVNDSPTGNAAVDDAPPPDIRSLEPLTIPMEEPVRMEMEPVRMEMEPAPVPASIQAVPEKRARKKRPPPLAVALDSRTELSELEPTFDEGVVQGIIRYCGIALRSEGSAIVHFELSSEVDAVRKFCQKKLGIKERQAIDTALSEVRGRLGARPALRVVVYYLLAKRFDKMHLFTRELSAT